MFGFNGFCVYLLDAKKESKGHLASYLWSTAMTVESFIYLSLAVLGAIAIVKVRRIRLFDGAAVGLA